MNATFLFIGLVAIFFSPPSQAEEPFVPFLDGLRERGYFQVALDYLNAMRDSPLVSDSQRALIPYQRSLTLIAYSRTQRDIERRLELLASGEDELRRFVASQSNHPKSFSARSDLANIIVERARITLEQAKSGNSKALTAQARKQFLAAIDELEKLESIVREQLDAIPKVLDTRDRKEAARAQRRTQLRADNLQTELLAAAVREELAATYGTGSDEFQEQLTMAAQQYDSIYKKYRSRLAGLYARMYQGRCNAQMGKTKDALAYYRELLDQPDEPADMRRLKTETLRLALDCWLAPNERKYLEAIKQSTRWIEAVPRESQREANMLAIRLGLARAYRMQAEDFATRGMDASLVKQSLVAARENAEFVAEEDGPLREAARSLAESLGSKPIVRGPTEPTTFAEATQVGRSALDKIGPISNRLATLQQQDRRGDSESSVAEQITSARAELTSLKKSALDAYRLAMALADASTPPTDLSLARYFLCYLYYIDGDLMRAAAVGDFVVQSDPESAAALPCAKIVLVCYNALLEQLEDTDDRSFEVQHIFDTTVFIAKTWPDSADATQVLSAGVPVMANANDVDKARVLTELIPKSSAVRWQADFITGQAMRRQALSVQLERSSADAQSSTDDESLEKLRSNSRQFLVDGFERLPAKPSISAFNVSAMLLTAEALLEDGKPEVAVKVLEHPELGPMTLTNKKHPVVADPILAQQCLQLGLRAYVASLGGGGAMAEKAKTTIQRFRNAVGTDPQSKRHMLAVYVQLARSIEQQISSASDSEKQRLSKVFESFLDELSSDSPDPAVLLWVADTFVGLGAGFDDSEQPISATSLAYYQKSAEALQNLLRLPGLDATLQTQVRARLATAKALQRKYPAALEDYRQLLIKQPNAVNLQVEAARVLARWGSVEPEQFDRAILGVGDGPQRTIWGWAKIASATMSQSELRDTFYEARFETARCRTERAKSVAVAERKQQLDEARRVIRTTRKLYPAVSDTVWELKFLSLENEIDELR